MSIQNSLNSAIGTVAGAAVGMKHIENQRESNILQAEDAVRHAEHGLKLSELEQYKADTEYSKAAENTASINNQVNLKSNEIDKMSQEITEANKFATINKDMKNTALDEALKSKSDKVIDKKISEAAAYEKAEQNQKEKAINRGYDKDMAKSALENLEKDRTAALDMEQRIYDRLEVLRENTRYSQENLDYAKRRYENIKGGK